MKFNVLEDNWIPVIYRNGNYREIGIKKCIEDANKIFTISNKIPYEKIALIRFLTAFITDAFELENAKDRERLFSSGKFEITVVNEYINKCINNYGASFDLFDSKRPFMISAYNKDLDFEDTKLSAVYLHLHLPNGDNVIHVVSQTEDDFKGDTPAEFLRSVLATYLYPTGTMMKGANSKTGALCYRSVKDDGTVIFEKQYGSMGINSGPNFTGEVPYFWWPEGDSLFETLVQCMRSKAELGNLPLNNPSAPWNEKNEIVGNTSKRGNIVPKVSFVSGLTFQSRRIVPVVDNDGKIRKAYISNGNVNPDNILWHDTFAVRLVKRGTGEVYNMRPEETKIAWRNIGNLTAASEHDWHLMPDVLKPIKKFDSVHYTKIYSLGMIPKKHLAGYQAMFFDNTLNIPNEYLTDEVLGNCLTRYMEIAEKVATCFDALKMSVLLKNQNKNTGKYMDDAQTDYWASLYNYIFNEDGFLEKLIDIYNNDSDFETKAITMLFKNIEIIVKRICAKEEQITSSWKMMVRVIECTSGDDGVLHKFYQIKKIYLKEVKKDD